MKKELIILLLFLGVFACKKINPESQISFLNGYWEIKNVTQPDGTEKEFSSGAIIDYIHVIDTMGFRKKVTPQLDGSFLTNDSAETFSIKIENDSLRLHYQTPFNNWVETVISAKDSLLVVKNEDNKIYTYKKFTLFKFN